MSARVALVAMALEVRRHLCLQRPDQDPAGTLASQLVQAQLLVSLFPRDRLLD
jgi:hypothetical protein